MQTVKERFLRYVKIDTQSEQNIDSIPSTIKQLDLARLHAAQEGQQPAAIVRSRLEWYHLGSDCYARRQFLTRREDYMELLRHLVGDRDTTLPPFATRVTPALWREYEQMIEKCRVLLSSDGKDDVR